VRKEREEQKEEKRRESERERGGEERERAVHDFPKADVTISTVV